MDSQLNRPSPQTDLCRVIERDGILMQLADGELMAPLADQYLSHVQGCTHCLTLASELVYLDALVKSQVLAELGETRLPFGGSARAGGVPITDLAIGERLPADVYDTSGHLLLMQGTLVSQNICAALEARGITEVYLQQPDPTPAPTPAPAKVARTLHISEENGHPRAYLQAQTPEPPVALTPEDIVFQTDVLTDPLFAEGVPAELPEGAFFGQRGAPRKFHPNDYRDLLFVAQAEPAIQQATKLRAYSQLERSLTALKEAGVADLAPVRQASDQIVTELLNDEDKTCSLADLFLVSSQLFSHCFNTLVTFISIGRALNIEAETLKAAGECVLFHDIGRVLPPLEGESPSEAYQAHPARGHAYLLSQGGFHGEYLSLVLNHHERFDGKGFARGLAGDQLSQLEQALILASTYDNLITDPVHGVKRAFHKAGQAILQSGGRLVSPELTRAFLNVFGMYPPGSLVELRSREIAVVREATFARPFQPRVSILRDASGGTLAEPILLDLSTERLPIERALDVDQVLHF